MFHFSRYQDILEDELDRRYKTNPMYSMRAFARDLDIHPSRLCEVLQGKQGLSESSASKITASLDLSKNERDYFVNLVIAQDSRSKTMRVVAKKNASKIRELHQETKLMDIDSFRVISDWYHFALMELTTLEGFSSDPAWISQKLGISLVETRAAIGRLKRVGLLIEKDHRLFQTEEALGTPNDVASSAIKKFHKQILEKAAVAVETQPTDSREFGCELMAINKNQLAKLKECIRKFRKEVATLVGGGASPKSSVYALSLQLFDLTQEDPK